MDVPSVSVIMPVFNGARWLPESLGSIVRQRVPDLEVIVVDDGSTEDITSVVRTQCPGARYIRQENRGAAAARNAGLDQARAPLIAFLDHDDRWPDGSLAARIDRLAAAPAALFVLGCTRFLAVEPAAEPWIATNLGAGLFRREVFAHAGRLDESRGLTDDVEWFLRVREVGLPYVTFATETLHYRRGTGGITHARSWGEPEVLTMLHASLARRRAAGAAVNLPLLSGSPHDPRAIGPVNHDGSRDKAH